MGTLKFETEYKTISDQIAERRKEIEEHRYILNKKYALEKFDENPYVEFKFYTWGNLFRDIFGDTFNREIPDYELTGGPFGWVYLNEEEIPKLIIPN